MSTNTNQVLSRLTVTNASSSVVKAAGIAVNALGGYFDADEGNFAGVNKFETAASAAMTVEGGIVSVLLGGTVAEGDPIVPTSATGVWTKATGDEKFYGIALAAGTVGLFVRAWVAPNSAGNVGTVSTDTKVYSLVDNVTLLELIAGKTLLAAVAGRTITVLDWTITALGGAATTGTAVTLSDTAASPVLIATVAVAALTENAVVNPSTATHVTNGAAGIGLGLTADKGITIEQTGTDMTVAVSFLVNLTYSIA